MRLFLGATVLALSAWVTTATAADVPEGMKQGNTQLCLQTAGKKIAGQLLDPHAPKQKDQIPAYCNCVSDAYWASVPQADFDAMLAELKRDQFNGPAAKAIGSKVNTRLEAAQKKCSKL